MNRLSHGELVQLAEEGRRKKMPRYIDAAPYEDGRIVLNKEDAGVPVAEIPTADVAQIVRCKDCKWNGGDCSWCTNPNLALGGDYASCLYIEPDWYCADGKRKEKTDVE